VRTKASVLFATILALGGLSGLVAVPAQAIARPVHHVHYLNPSSIKNPVLRREALQAQRWELAHPGHALPVHTTWSETRHTDAPNAAGDPCTTISGTEEVKNAVDVELMWFKLSTYFCWSGPEDGPWSSADKVTSHSTTWSVGVTTAGSIVGWAYNQNVTGIEFHCFTDGYGFSGGINSCSGNYEYDEVEFEACLLKVGCYDTEYPYVWEAEYLNGAWNNGGGLN
jgi:hypothetical protein